MEAELKLCPFCAEEIKVAAIVCKHCGRDLPGYSPGNEDIKPNSTFCSNCRNALVIDGEYCSFCGTKANIVNQDSVSRPLPNSEASSMVAPPKSPWQAAKPFGNVILGLSLAVGLLYRIPFFELGSEILLLSLVGLAFVSIINYVFSTVLAALVIWAWRKFQYQLIVFIFGLVLLFFGLRNFSPDFSFLSQTSSVNSANTSRPSSVESVPTATLWNAGFSSNPSTWGCIKWSQVRESHLGQVVCIYGLVDSARRAGSTQYIYFSATSTYPEFIVLVIGGYFPDLEPGDCFIVEGVVEDNGAFLFINPASPDTVLTQHRKNSALCN